MEFSGTIDDRPAECPKCRRGDFTDAPSCAHCGYTMRGVRLYDPKRFTWMALLFSGLVPLYMAAANWGQVGETRRKRLLLAGGIAGFAVLFVVLALLPEIPLFGKMLGHLINYPIGMMLRDTQRPLYRAGLKLGAAQASTAKGILFGFGLILCTLVVPVGAAIVYEDMQLGSADKLFEERKFDAAAQVYQRVLRTDPENAEVAYRYGVCHFVMQHWDEAGRAFEAVLKTETNHAATYALLAHVRSVQERPAEARDLAAKARAIEPGIFSSLAIPDPGAESGN